MTKKSPAKKTAVQRWREIPDDMREKVIRELEYPTKEFGSLFYDTTGMLEANEAAIAVLKSAAKRGRKRK